MVGEVEIEAAVEGDEGVLPERSGDAAEGAFEDLGEVLGRHRFAAADHYGGRDEARQGPPADGGQGVAGSLCLGAPRNVGEGGFELVEHGCGAGIESRLAAAIANFTRRDATIGSIPSAWVLRSQKGIGKAAIQEIGEALFAFARARFGPWPGAEREEDEAGAVLDDGLGALAELFGE